MKKILSSFLVFLSLVQSVFAETIILRPSLTAQMNRQSTIDKVNYTLEKKIKNQLRLAEVAAQRRAKSQKTTTTQNTTQSPATKTPLPPPNYAVSSNIP